MNVPVNVQEPGRNETQEGNPTMEICQKRKTRRLFYICTVVYAIDTMKCVVQQM